MARSLLKRLDDFLLDDDDFLPHDVVAVDDLLFFLELDEALVEVVVVVVVVGFELPIRCRNKSRTLRKRSLIRMLLLLLLDFDLAGGFALTASSRLSIEPTNDTFDLRLSHDIDAVPATADDVDDATATGSGFLPHLIVVTVGVLFSFSSLANDAGSSSSSSTRITSLLT